MSTCAACGEPVDLARLHVSIARQVEREDELGNYHVRDSTVVQYRHLDCPVYLTRSPDGEIVRAPVRATKNADPDGCPDTVLGPCEWACARCGRGHDCAEAR